MADSPGERFRVRLNCVDYYQNAPSSMDPPFRGYSAVSSTQRSKQPHVPVIRVFGATATGQKVCAHIHGALPYLFIPYSESLEADQLEKYIAALRHSIDHALAISYRRNPYSSNPRDSVFVAHVSIVKGVPFFGYNVGYKHFLKIYLFNPDHMTRFSDLLQSGAVMQRTFQPYEAHLQYLLQWMCDFNLYGCAFIEVAAEKVRWRAPVLRSDELDFMGHEWHDRSVGQSNILDENSFPRRSHCQLEIDIRVEDILNRLAVEPRELHHSFIERLSSLETLPPEEKLVQSMAGLWKDETIRRKKRLGLTDPSSSPFPPELLVSMSADPRNDSKGGWIHEDEFRQLIEDLSRQENKAQGGRDVDFDAFIAQTSGQDSVPTVLQSVTELFQETLLAKHGQQNQPEEDPGDGHEVESDNDHDGDDSPGAEAGNVPIVGSDFLATWPADKHYGSEEENIGLEAPAQKRRSSETGFGDGLDEVNNDNDNDEPKLQTEQNQTKSISVENGGLIQDDLLKRQLANENGQPSKRVKIETHSNERLVSKHAAFRVKDIRPKKVPSKMSDLFARDVAAISTIADLATVPSAQLPHLSQQSSASNSSKSGKLGFRVSKNLSDQKGPQPSVGESVKTSTFTDLTSTTSVSARANTRSSDRTGTSVRTPRKAKIDPGIVSAYASAFAGPIYSKVFFFGVAPPSFADVERTLVPSVVYQDAYYSNENDVPERPRQYAGQEFRLESATLPYLPNFDPTGGHNKAKTGVTNKTKDALAEERRQRDCSLKAWEIMQPPPTWDDVQRWLDFDDELGELNANNPTSSIRLKQKNRPAPELSQIEGPTQKNKHGFKYSQRRPSTSVQYETGYMSTMSLEVHINTQGDLAPDPERDEVAMIMWYFHDDSLEDDESRMGILVLTHSEEEQLPDRIRRIVRSDVEVDSEDTELDLLNRAVDVVRTLDPDVLTGFEVHNSSWGYLIERARLKYEFNLPDEFSRMKAQSHGRFGKDADRWGFTHTSTVRITGRHTINIWRAMRSELNLLQYTLENVVFHLLHRRIPHYSFATLTRWYQSRKPRDLKKVLDYFVTRTKLDLEILEANGLIPRTSEQARLLGVDFFSVFSRGSQFKVESLMFRIAKPESFVLVSPSRKQVGSQNALECLPLVMEPQSAFYTSPLLVLDFQSLYPSVMIAYNYCYSTCLGRVVSWRGSNKLGFADFQRAPGLLELVKDKLNIAPNGMMYVKPEMRKSLLSKMLAEILETRVMVKSGMKVDKDDKTLQQLLNNRQLALKLIANVTYGYTSASFSGRMPCSEIADSIVSTGRETLEKAIAFIHSVERWGAEVVYGDTDSLFVYLRGKTRADAFRIGDEIAKAVTNMNPRPVKLKFEKVYHPCVLLAKKRYVGYKYDSLSQTKPEFDAKGIETVRRDGTPAEQKIEEKALRLLFRSSDLSEVKRYFQAQCSKVMNGRVSIQDFCFAREVKLGTYADRGPPPPGALIATRRMLRDPRREPQYGERVPYVVIAGAPGARLWERCVEPERLVYDEYAELDADYYISKNLIPPLERIFNLVGANVRGWYDEMPKVQRIKMLGGVRESEGYGKGKRTMESYMGSSLCLVCRGKLPSLAAQSPESGMPLCGSCRMNSTQRSLVTLREKLRKAEKRSRELHDVCRSCAGLPFADDVKCDSRDCPVFYSRVKADTQAAVVANGVGSVLDGLESEILAREDKFEW